jgi:flagellar biosynthesis protein FliQ
MTVDQVAMLSERMLWTAFIVSLPLLLTALAVGVFISLVQTVTGVQEMTLTFVPKILSVIVILIVSLPWITQVLLNFTYLVFRVFSGQGA